MTSVPQRALHMSTRTRLRGVRASTIRRIVAGPRADRPRRIGGNQNMDDSWHDRFDEKVEIDSATGCWLWTAAMKPNGYGCFGLGAQQYAHRVSYERHKGPIPEGLEIDHLCRVRNCVNPDHLEAVTHRENVRRGTVGLYNLRKIHCPQGHEYNPENTRVTRKNLRNCRVCDRDRHAAARRRARAV